MILLLKLLENLLTLLKDCSNITSINYMNIQAKTKSSILNSCSIESWWLVQTSEQS